MNIYTNYFKQFKTLFPLILNIYLLFWGLGIIILQVYIRFFIERPTYNLNELRSYITVKHYILFFFFVFLHFCLVIIFVNILYKRKNNNIKACEILLFIPICFHIFLKIFYSFTERNIPVIQNYFSEIKGIEGPIYDEEGVIVRYNTYQLTIKPENAFIDASEEFNYITRLLCIGDIVNFMKKYSMKISPYIINFTSSVSLIGGIYRVYFLFF